MSVRDKALAAHREAEARRTVVVDELQAKRELTEREAEERVLALVRESALAEWFAGAEWEVYATAEDGHWTGMRGYRAGGRFTVTPLVGVVCSGRPGGTDPEWAGVPCFGIGPLEPNASEVPDGSPRDRARVFYVHTRHDEGYTSWEGAEVRSLEELGARIAKHEARERERLKQRELASCGCARHGTDPSRPGLRCMHAGLHAVRLAAAETATCEMDIERAVREWQRRLNAVSLADVDVTGKSLPTDHVR
jgi:hypothetical protein